VSDRRQLAPLYAAGFVTAFGAHAVAANLGGYGHARHVSLVELGILLALYDGAEVVLKPVFGALADRVGAKPVLFGGLIGFAIASAFFAIAGEPGFLGVARLAQGAAAAAFSPAAGALVALSGGRAARGRAFGGYGGAKGLGYIAGPLVGGLIVAGGGYRTLFAVLGVLALAVGGWAAFVVESPPPSARQRETLLSLVTRVRDTRFLRPVVALACATAAFSAGVGFLPVVGLRAGLGAIATGAVVTVLAVTATVVQPYAGRALDAGRIGADAMGSGLLIATLGALVAALSPGFAGLVVAAALIGVGVGLATPLGFAGLADAAPAGLLGRTMGAGEVGRELGDAGGPLLVGGLSVVGLGVGFAGLAATIGAAGVVLSGLPRRRREATPDGRRRVRPMRSAPPR
jgi:DHA1 family tetracycline resistance protein-like MFS transporter